MYQLTQPSSDLKPTALGRFLWQALTKGRPVYTVERQTDSALSGFAQIPWGCLYRIVFAQDETEWLAQAPDAETMTLRFNVDEQRLIYGAEQKILVSRYLLVQADYLWAKGNQTMADSVYERVRSIGAGFYPVISALGRRYIWQGRNELAISLYEQALIREDDAVLRNRLGAIYGRQKQLDKAREQFERAIELNGDLAEAYANLASVYGRQGNIEEATKQLELALKYDANNQQALENLAKVYVTQGKRDKARELLKRLLEINPARQDVRELLDKVEQGTSIGTGSGS